MVRVEIKSTGLRNLVVCCRFPDNYPVSALLLELKSRTLSEELLQKLTTSAETEVKKFIRKEQVLIAIKFLKDFLIKTPLSVCYDEISNIKKMLADKGELKLKQKVSAVQFTVSEGGYFFKCNIYVPEDYYNNPAQVTNAECNLPNVMEKFLLAQSHVIGIQCSKPPATRLVKFNDGKQRTVGGKVIQIPPVRPANFQSTPSLEKVVLFLVRTFREFVLETCQVCSLKCLPDDPKKAQTNDQADDHVERVYCGHLFHLSCLMKYMKTPPFQGGKKCGICGQLISHAKWKLNERQAEDRWAHEQARERELQEVADFFE